jgi:transcription elongation GreA/GreB family factor
MQLPKRRSQQNRPDDGDVVIYLTEDGLRRLKDQIERLKRLDEPTAIKDVSEAVQKGDLSENAEYQEARARLTRIQNRLVHLDDRLKRVILIKTGGSDEIQIGSKVTVETEHGVRKSFEIVGPNETDPARGRISYLSPIGSALMKHRKSDEITIEISGRQVLYRVVGME